jgi:hypothetical protein
MTGTRSGEHEGVGPLVVAGFSAIDLVSNARAWPKALVSSQIL